ncbi:MAG: hypothetical protein HY438_01500 [DPANN group archaeon]|nr:hypothetical protein [DPANN group archaeon]
MYATNRLTQLADYVRQNPIKGWAVGGGLVGFLIGIGTAPTNPTPLPPRYLIQYLITTPLILAGAAALAIWLTQGIEARFVKHD